jgi:hypothetical protein
MRWPNCEGTGDFATLSTRVSGLAWKIWGILPILYSQEQGRPCGCGH